MLCPQVLFSQVISGSPNLYSSRLVTGCSMKLQTLYPSRDSGVFSEKLQNWNLLYINLTTHPQILCK